MNRYTRRWVLFVCMFLVFMFAGAVWAWLDTPEPPNILLIVSDDQRYDQMAYMPRTRALIFDQGVTFDRAYATTARCCPSRATILTGLYAHNHRVRLNADPLTGPTIVQALDARGYFTGVVGKYLNSYPTRPEDPPHAEFDYWVTYISGAQTAAYYDTWLNVNGRWQAHSGYQTYLLRDYALEFLAQAEAQEIPFFLLFTPYAPHLPAHPAPGDDQLYLDEPPYFPPNYNPAALPGKPDWLQALPYLAEEQIASTRRDWLAQIQTLHALDLTVESLLQTLEAHDELENTIIIYLSDNGEFLGEHRLPIGKIYVYEEATHVPLAIRYPALQEEAWVDDTHLVGNIDIAPTLWEAAGMEEEDAFDALAFDGRSLLPLLRNQAGQAWRAHLLLEGWPINVAYVGDSPPFQAIHTGRYVYVETEGDRPELYDLERDPYQLRNEVDNVEYAGIKADLQAALAQERAAIAANAVP